MPARLRAPRSLLDPPIMTSSWHKASEGAALMIPRFLPSVWFLYSPASLWHLFLPWQQQAGGALESWTTLTGSASSTFQTTDFKSCGESRERGGNLAQEGEGRPGVAVRALQDR